MQDIEKLVKDKALFYWLDIEIGLLHLYLYWIGAVVIKQTWAWVLAGALSLLTIIYIGRVAVKITKLKAVCQDDASKN